MKSLKHIIFLAACVIMMTSFTPFDNMSGQELAVSGNDTQVNWKSFESSIKLKNQGKKYFIFVYTDWCSWCKKMKSTTLQDPEIVSLLNEKFVPVMFNAESKDPVTFKDHEFKFVSGGRNGYHELAAALLNNQLSYPSIVFLDEEMNMIQPLPGYKSAQDLRIILTFLGDKIYEEMDFNRYYKQQTEG